MASIFDIFASQLGDEQLGKIAKQIGADKNQTQDAISMTLPALIEALGRQADQSATSSANSRSDSGSIVEMLGGGMGNSTSIQADPISVNRSSQNSNRSSFEDILPRPFLVLKSPRRLPYKLKELAKAKRHHRSMTFWEKFSREVATLQLRHLPVMGLPTFLVKFSATNKIA